MAELSESPRTGKVFQSVDDMIEELVRISNLVEGTIMLAAPIELERVAGKVRFLVGSEAETACRTLDELLEQIVNTTDRGKAKIELAEPAELTLCTHQDPETGVCTNMNVADEVETEDDYLTALDEPLVKLPVPILSVDVRTAQTDEVEVREERHTNATKLEEILRSE